MELRDYLRILYRHWILIVVTTLLGAAFGLIATLLVTPQYEAESKLYVSVQTDSQASGDLLQGANFAQQNMATFVELATTKSVLGPVIDDLDLGVSTDELAERIDVAAPSDSTLLTINIRDDDPARAAEIANEMGSQMRILIEEELEPPEDGSDGSPVRINMVEPASEPQNPVSPRSSLNIALGVLLGLAAGIGIATVRAMFDTRIRVSEDIEALMDAPLLGRIPFDPKSKRSPLIVHLDPQSPRAESFRTLRTNLQFLAVASGSKGFAVSSSGPGEGKSTTAANLALALADTGQKVALVDCDLRRPRIADYMGIEGSVGLTDLLIERVGLSEVLQHWGHSQLYVLPAGQIPPNPSELLGSAAMDRVLPELQESVDVIILDTPPVLSVTDAVVVGDKSNGVILVAAAGVAKKQALSAAASSLETAKVQLLGVVATMLPLKGPSSYGYGYGSYSSTGRASNRFARRGANRLAAQKSNDYS